MARYDAAFLISRNVGYGGSTGRFFRVEPGVLLKAPVRITQEQEVLRPTHLPHIEKNYATERQILTRLGEHPRVVRYLGWQTEFPTGILLAEASHGNLQCYIDAHGDKIPLSNRKKWFRHAIEALAYIHGKGVIHCDLRPDNFLVHTTSAMSLDLLVCDFGGSMCKELDVDGGSLPDDGFCDPNLDGDPTYTTDIFGLGSVLYFINKGHWPHRGPGGFFESLEESEAYGMRVNDYFKRGVFPVTGDQFGGEIILKCWTNKYKDVDSILADLSRLE